MSLHLAEPGTASGPAAPPLANLPVWEEGGWEALPRLEGEVRAEVCVVGLGGSGLACVNELLAAGVDVVGVDAGGVAAGAAGRNGGFLLAGTAQFHHDAVAQYGRERAVALYRLTLAEIERISGETPEAVRRVGSLRIAADGGEVEDCHAQLAAMQADGLPVEWYRGSEGEGLLVPNDGAFNPLLRCRLLARKALANGARLFEHSPVVEVREGLVRAPAGSVRCRRVIVAVDGRLERILPQLGERVRTARLQMVATAPLPELRFPRPVYLRYGYEWWQQLPDRRIALGGFRDQGGASEWTHDAEPGEGVQGMIEGFLRQTLGVREPITHRWAASVGYTEDGIPYLGEATPGVWACGGYSGTGNVIGAICGRAAAQLALHGTSELATHFLA